jgi:hypothetical protein
MPGIRREKVPEAILRHLYLRFKQRHFAPGQLMLWADWLDEEVEAPDGKWFKRFPGMIVCDEGELVKTFLLPDQLPTGTEIV